MLEAFLADLARKPFAWGECDCALAIADWWLLNHGVDPAAHLRGTYADEEGCARLLRDPGGLPRLVVGLARSVGARRTRDPQPGDFGVVSYRGAWTCAIRTRSGRWAMKAPLGVTVTSDCRLVAAWSL